ncbi:MAG: ATP-dependent DNA helicase [Duodenibacillus sp.]|nr:ATP-dependent DNA helicase [Duodenibacillus sp.]
MTVLDRHGDASQDIQSDFEKSVQELFAENGPLSKATAGYVRREGQVAFARTVARAIESGSTEVIEAGTGTGKTFAYLTPALLAGVKVIVSTAGKPLQDQLFHKDLPAVEAALGVNASAAVLKGRANYICKYRLQTALAEGELPSRQAVLSLKKIKIFADTDPIGDRASVEGVAADDPVWPFVTSTRDNCLGPQKCPFKEDCFVYNARRSAKASDIVIVNHHLYLSSLSIRDEDPDADMLPQAQIVIIDEAHKLPEIASNFFGSELSTFSVKETMREIKRRTLSKFKTRAPEGTNWDKLTDAPVHILMDLGMWFHEIGLHEGDTKKISDIANIEDASSFLSDAAKAIERLYVAIEPLIAQDDELEKLASVSLDMQAELARWSQSLKNPAEMGKTESGVPVVRWISRSATEARFHETPLSFAQDLSRLRNEQAGVAWVMTSATLATENGDFSHFLSEMGLADQANTHVWPSPFDYPEQAILYVPPGMPDPKGVERDDFIDRLMQESWPVIDMVGGRTFVLCTSYRAMQRAAEVLREYVAQNGRPYTVYMQGEDSRRKILEQYRRDGHAILVGSMSFWEGIDIKGENLSVVVIDKLPFAPIGDPVLDAKSKWIKEQGGSPFRDHQIPLAAIALKQGTGRLIRSESDRGILIIGDPRVLPKSAGGSGYGSIFLNSLPAYSRTRRLERVMDFWEHPGQWQ